MTSSARTAIADGPEGDAAEPAAGRLVVVSNRVPFPSEGQAPSAGGLAVGLEDALRKNGGLWFGWSGETVESGEPGFQRKSAGNVEYAVTDLTQRDIEEYYHGFANRALWPICHYRLDLTGFAGKDTAGYFRVNEFFARRLAPLLRPDDVIWVHDYHFIPMAAYLRQLGFKNRIGFFLHIPWPPSDLATALPAYDTLMRGFAAYDVVGFQTPLDTANFVQCLIRGGVGRALGSDLYEAYGRSLTVRAFPIGIDTAGFRAEAKRGSKNPIVRRTRESLFDRDLIIGVDRLDYSKGIPQRIAAFSCFVQRYPGFHRRVTYLQVTPRSRSEVPEYADMQREVAELAGDTNGRFGDVDWVPIRYINRPIGRAALAGLFRTAKIGLVTPLRDGMNLVAKEYVASQSSENPGVLILSRFAGAAQQLDAALLVNPYDTESTAAMIARALEMPLEERIERWNALIETLRASTIDDWRDDFLAALAASQDDLSATAVEVERDRRLGAKPAASLATRLGIIQP